MAVTVTLSQVRTQESGVVLVDYADGSQLEFASRADMIDRVQLATLDATALQYILLQWWLARDADANNPALVEGKSATSDPTAPNPVTVR